MNTEKKGFTKKHLLALLAVLAVAVVLGAVYLLTRQPAAAGQKTIGVSVVLADGSSTDTEITTEQAYLRGALEENKIIEGTESQYGLFVTTVNGVTANDAEQEWWCFTKGGAQLDTGVDTTPIANGDHFEITLTKGY